MGKDGRREEERGRSEEGKGEMKGTIKKEEEGEVGEGDGRVSDNSNLSGRL